MNTNYRTLHKDIGLIQRSNNGWDLWFYNGDTVKAEDFHSLQVGIIIACLTSWNYLNRYGNPTYEIFGNRAYELLKANKSSMVAYKIQQYFIECLKRMRRVYEIVYLNVSEIPSKPYTFLVEFEVISIDNQLVNGDFILNTDLDKSSSYIDYTIYMPYASPLNPLTIDLWLKNEYGGGLDGELVYMYVDDEFVGVKGVTDSQGYLRIVYDPIKFNVDSTIRFEYHGNSNYNSSISDTKHFQQTPYCFNVENKDDEDVLSIFDNIGDAKDRVYLAEIVQSIEGMDYATDRGYNKLYLVYQGQNIYTMYNKNHNRMGQVRLEQSWDYLNMTDEITVGDERLVVYDGNKWFLLSDNHVYYMEGYEQSHSDITLSIDEEYDESPQEILWETVFTTVKIIWDDNNNSDGLRPANVGCTLSDGTIAVLNNANNWTYTIEVPKYNSETNEEITYDWSVQDVLGYTLKSITVVDNTTIFTWLYRRPPTPHEPPTIEIP